jgi:PadR family transcriptional regulator, regulatory protein AphA
MQPRLPLAGEYAVLGLLALRPMHGYEMARYFAADELGEVCPVDHGSLYTYLRNLEERAFVSHHETRVGQRPPRKVFHLTPAGAATVEGWLRAPVERMRAVRLEFLLKLYFLHHLDAGAELQLVRGQVDMCQAYETRLAARAETATGFDRLVTMSKLSAATATISWLTQYAAELESTGLADVLP